MELGAIGLRLLLRHHRQVRETLSTQRFFGSGSSEVAEATLEGLKLLMAIRLASNGPVVKHGTSSIYSAHVDQMASPNYHARVYISLAN